jgi:hypothetical protein
MCIERFCGIRIEKLEKCAHSLPHVCLIVSPPAYLSMCTKSRTAEQIFMKFVTEEFY